MREEISRGIEDGSSSKNEDEENCALAAKARKGKGKKTLLNPVRMAKSVTCPK